MQDLVDGVPCSYSIHLLCIGASTLTVAIIMFSFKSKDALKNYPWIGELSVAIGVIAFFICMAGGITVADTVAERMAHGFMETTTTELSSPIYDLPISPK